MLDTDVRKFLIHLNLGSKKISLFQLNRWQSISIGQRFFVRTFQQNLFGSDLLAS